MKLLPLSLALALSLPTAFAAKKTSQEYWQETGLTTEIMLKLKFLAHDNCVSTINQLQGCVAAINSVGARANPPIELVPQSLSGDPTFVGGMPFRIFPNFVLASRAKADNEPSAMAAWKKESTRREKLKNALQAIVESGTNADFELMFSHVLERSVKDKADDSMVAAKAITALLNASDDAHAHLDARAEVSDSLNDATEDFVGIGATLQELNGRIIIQGPTDGGPAKKAGILPNDIIASIDGVPTDGMSVDQAAKRIRGAAGTEVALKILRKGKMLEISISRARIVLENVVAETRSELGENYGYIRLRNFMDNHACEKIEGMVKRFEEQKVKGLMLDLRGNGGGLLDQALCLGGLFVGRQVIAKVKDLQSETFQDLRSEKDQITRLPLAVLIDAGSASASEILSGALQDYKRAWVLGERSFGKATVQSPEAFLGNPRIMYFHTIQRFYQPSGRTNQIVGIIPDLTVPVKPNATEEERFALREAELLPNALSAVGPTWVQPRVEEMKRLENCVSSGNLAQKTYAKAIANSETADYQVMAAQEALLCRVP